MNLLDFYFPEWFFVAVNLVILIVVLKKLFWKPVNKILEKRQEKAEKTERDSEESARLLNEMVSLRTELDHDLEARTAQVLMEARSRAGREYDRIVADAENKANLILKAAKTKAEQEQERMAAEMKKRLVDAAVDAAGFLMRSAMDSEHNQRLVEGFLADQDASR